MAVSKRRIFTEQLTSDFINQRGASIMEVLLAMAVVAITAPFVYNQISNINNSIRDMATSRAIIDMRDTAMNFVRLYQDSWPEIAQIKLADNELDEISELPTAGFIDKYSVNGASVTDVYLAFDLEKNNLRTAQIANYIGPDAAIVGDDGIAYGTTWAVAAPDFKAGNLIYRISRNFTGEDKSKYLHRGTSGEDDLNMMQRDLNMGGYNVYDVGTVMAESAKIKNTTANFIESASVMADTVYFSSGANMDGGNSYVGSMRVTGDITGFRNITADNLNGAKYTTHGRIISDRATVTNSVNVANDFILKSDSSRTIGGFTAITANSLTTSYVSAEEMIFYDNFGLTISGELLVSTTSPVKIGSWVFPSTTPPKFIQLSLSRAQMPPAPNKDEFGVIMGSGWQSVPPQNAVR